jgi:hypothetical protein
MGENGVLLRFQNSDRINFHRSLRRNQHGQTRCHQEYEGHGEVCQRIDNADLIHKMAEYPTEC